MSEFTVKPIDNRNPIDAQYAEWMEKELKSKQTWKRPPSTVQAASTQRVLNMNEDELKAYRSREIDVSKAQVRDEDGNIFINERKVTAREIALEEDIRHKSRNTQGDFISYGEGLTSAPKERKERAISAFTYSPPAELTPIEKDRISVLNALLTVDQEIEIKKSMLEKAKDFISSLVHRKKTSVKKDSLGHVLYKASGGKDEDLDIHD